MVSKHHGSYSASHFRVHKGDVVVNGEERSHTYGRIGSYIYQSVALFCAISELTDEYLGITMKLPGSDLVGMDASISLSHCVARNTTDALLICRSSSQMGEIADAIVSLAAVATHPAAIPTTLCSLHQYSLLHKIDSSWEHVLKIEHASGQSGIAIEFPGGHVLPSGKCDDPDLSRSAIGATQFAIAWETYTSGSQALIDAVQSFLKSYTMDNNSLINNVLTEQSQVLLEYLGVISQRAESLYYRAKHLRARAEVQVDAV